MPLDANGDDVKIYRLYTYALATGGRATYFVYDTINVDNTLKLKVLKEGYDWNNPGQPSISKHIKLFSNYQLIPLDASKPYHKPFLDKVSDFLKKLP